MKIKVSSFACKPIFTISFHILETRSAFKTPMDREEGSPRRKQPPKMANGIFLLLIWRKCKKKANHGTHFLSNYKAKIEYLTMIVYLLNFMLKYQTYFLNNIEVLQIQSLSWQLNSNPWSYFDKKICFFLIKEDHIILGGGLVESVGRI